MADVVWPLRGSKLPYRKPDSCRGCPLYGSGLGFGLPDDQGGGNEVLLVGESLGQHEAEEGTAFVGPAGGQLNQVFRRGGFKREDFAGIDNTIHCQPPKNQLTGTSYEYQAISACAPFLDDTIRRLQPKAIVALGGVALRRLTGQSGIMKSRGFIFDSPYNIPVVGTFHPSYLLPRKKSKGSAKYTWVMIMDMRKAVRVAAGKRDLYPQSYLMDPGFDKAYDFMGEYDRTPDAILAWDLETLYKLKQKNEQKLKLENKQVITRISFAFRPGYAMTVPWIPEYLEKVINPLFRLNRPKVGWNSKGFDEPIIILQERMELNGLLYDAMDQFHVFQPNIERGLEFASSILTDHLQPWKHRSQSDPEWYSCVDSDATITNKLRMDSIMTAMEVGDGPVWQM